MAGLRAEQDHTHQREYDLRKGLQSSADRNDGGGIRQGHFALRQMPRHEHRAADLPARHQTVCGFPHPARQHRVAEGTARVGSLEQHANRNGVEQQRQ